MRLIRFFGIIGFWSLLFLFQGKNFYLLSKKNEKAKQQIDQQSSQKAELSPNWPSVQKQAKDTVVQLFVQIATFNWLEPFKAPEQNKVYGTGFFINDQGYLLSNFHVIDEAESIKMQIPSIGKQRFQVEVVGVCPERDIALLRLTDEDRKEIEGKLGRIPFLDLGDSDKVFRTQQVLALGYPLGQEKLKSTQGIVSGREDLNGDSYIQVTAPINEGNSGGPSLSSDGKVIGINTANVARAQNVGYIIPINDIKNVIQELYKQRFLRKPELGYEKSNGTSELVVFLNNPEPGGLYISSVYKNSLFDKVGIQEGDMIYSINQHKVDLYEETNVPWSEDKVHLNGLVNRLNLDQKIDLELYRKGKLHKKSFTFSLVDPLPIRFYYPEYEPIDYEVIGGMVVMELTLNHLSFFDETTSDLLKYKKRENQYVSRLVITNILNNSQARHARVMYPGDIIDEINGQKVYSLKDLRVAVEKNDMFLTCKNESKKFMVLSVKKVIEDEERLSERYLYKKSCLVDKFEEKFRKKE